MSPSVDARALLQAHVAAAYTVERELGTGGMATVYLAQDRRHGRKVALKVLRQDFATDLGAERFLREIRLAAGLTHPHIVPLFDSGEVRGTNQDGREGSALLYYVMPVLEGESLRDRLRKSPQLPVDEAIRIACEVADALDYAHRQDVVHRDIKPENILLHDGHALVADFGIGKALAAGSVTGGDAVREPTTGAITSVGIAIGTPAYMSPEQAAGDDALDGRSDLYSLGCVLYEMLVGEQPFTGPTAQSVIAKRFTSPPPDATRSRVTVPSSVNRAIMRALALAPADRFATGAQFADALRHATNRTDAAPSDEKSIAVLPFANMSGDSENEYFSDGITEEIINALVQLPMLRVAARTSVFAFKGKNEDLRGIAERLNVRTVLEGSVRKAGDRIRITAQLINASDGFHLWSERYDRKLDDVFAVQDEIARTIVETLKVRLSGDRNAPLVKPATSNMEAYELYLQGRYFWGRRGAGLLTGLRFFEAALAKDPDYALAHTGVADTYCLLGFYGVLPALEAMPRARAAAERALALDPSLAEAHSALGFIRLSFDWDIPAAISSFERAIALKPSYVPARYWYASAFAALSRPADAVRIDEEAVRLEPLSLFANAHLGWMKMLDGRAADGLVHFDFVLELDGSFVLGHWLRGWALIALGSHDEGLDAFGAAVTHSGRSAWMVASLAAALAYTGRRDDARALLAELIARASSDHVRAYHLAMVYGNLGEVEPMIEWCEKARVERDPTAVYAGFLLPMFTPIGVPLHSLGPERYRAFVESLGIIRA